MDRRVPTAQGAREVSWRGAGWVSVWVSTKPRRSGKPVRYWCRPGHDGLLRLFHGGATPPVRRNLPDFYVKARRVYRDVGHPDGPSSSPSYVIKRSSAFPAGARVGPKAAEVFIILQLGAGT